MSEITRGRGSIKMLDNGLMKVTVRVDESRFTKYRFVLKRDIWDGDVEYYIRDFDTSKGVFEQIDDDDVELSEYYEYYTDTYEEALEHLRDVLNEIAKEDEVLARKDVVEDYIWSTTPDGVVNLQKK